MTKEQKKLRRLARKWGNCVKHSIRCALTPIYTGDELNWTNTAYHQARVAARMAIKSGTVRE
jgi:hypothetical protein